MESESSALAPVRSILNLPSEILGIVTSYLDQDDVASCFGIQNAHFTRLLQTTGSITSLELRGSQNRLSRSLGSFSGLRKLVVQMNVKEMDWDSFLDFPRNLTWLELRNEFSLSSASSVSATLPLLRTLCLGVSLKEHHGAWLSMMPSTLETLEVLGFSYSPLLPASLTSLKVKRASPIPQAPLPPSLRILDIRELLKATETEINSFLTILPPSLDSLNLHEVRRAIFSSTLLFLPEGLTHLCLGATTHRWNNSHLFHASGALIAFPSRLTSLKLVGILNMTDFAPLSRHLTTLDVNTPLSNDPNFFLHLAQILPPNLLHFLIALKDDPICAPFSVPKNLQLLHIDASWFHFDLLHSIPKSVTSLQLPPIQTQTQTSLDQSPPWPLQALSFPHLQKFKGHSHPSTLSLLHCLAVGCPNLSKIELDGSSDLPSQYCAAFTPSNFDNVCQSIMTAFSSLPPLHVQDVDTDLSMTAQDYVLAKNETQPSLAELKPCQTVCAPPFRFNDQLKTFWAYECAFGDPMMGMIPGSLTVLGLPCSSFITNDHFTALVQRCHHLKKLFCGSPAITGSSFAALPRQLTELSLPKSTLIRDDDIAHLPRTLTTLCLDRETLLTDQMGPSLPPKMTYMVLSANENISKQIAHYLPTTLRVSVLAKKVSILISYGKLEVFKGWNS